MVNFSLLNDYYKKFSSTFHFVIPDGIYTLNLELLYQIEALHFTPAKTHADLDFTKQFTLIESPNKITLVNDQFVVWLISEERFDLPFSTIFIALNQGDKEPKLEAAIFASGIYNSPKILLATLEKFLYNIIENESVVEKMKKAS